jgi:hypothetical protein
VAPDGDGPALVLKAANLDPAVPSNWRASYSTGGSPGVPDVLTVADWRAQHFSAAELADPEKEAAVWGDLADPDNDGLSNLAEFALGGSPVSAASPPAMTAAFDPGGTRLRAAWHIREGTAGVTLTPQFSGDLTTWTGGATVISGPESQGDGTALIVVEDPGPGPRRYFRVLIRGE